MVLHGLIAKAATTVVTGAVGVAAFELARKAVAKAPLHEASVTATAWGLVASTTHRPLRQRTSGLPWGWAVLTLRSRPRM